MKVQDIMTQSVKTCGSNATLAEAVALLWEADCGTLPVLENGGKVIGMITDRDIAIALGTQNRRASDTSVGEVMSSRLHFCKPEDDIHEALATMSTNRVRRLPVLNEDGVLQGVLSMNDVTLQAGLPPGRKTPDLTFEDVVSAFRSICAHGETGETSQERAAATP